MKAKTKMQFGAALLGCAAVASFAADTPPTAAQGAFKPAPGTFTVAPVPVSPGQRMLRLRMALAARGVDPDGERGQLVIAWVERVSGNAAAIAALTAGGEANRRSAVFAQPPSASARERIVHDVKEIIRGSDNGCHLFDGTTDIVAMIKTTPLPVLRSLIDFLDAVFVSEPSDEHYTTAALLDVDRQLEAALEADKVASRPGIGGCEALSALLDAADKIPARDTATFELLRLMMGGKTMADTVLEDPVPYRDEVFDERLLSARQRAQLPKDGSMPLPFTHLSIEGDLVYKTKPSLNYGFVDEFFNRHDNGVVVQVSHERAAARPPVWTDFYVSYGLIDVRMQSVAASSDATALKAVPDTVPLALALGALKEGETIDVPLPQPDKDGVMKMQCKVGATKAAKIVYPSLTGSAVQFECTETTSTGEVARTEEKVWLPDYGIFYGLAATGKYGRCDVVLRKVTIE